MLSLIFKAFASDVPSPGPPGGPPAGGGVSPTPYPSQVPVPPTQAHCLSLESDASLWNQIQLSDLTCIFNRVYNAAILSIGGVFLIWAIISGIRYITAGGDEKAVADARRSLTMAVLGFIIVIGAYAIIKILGNVIGIDTGNFPIFVIPSP